MSTTLAITPAAGTKYSDQPVGLAGVQSSSSLFTLYQNDDLFSTSIPAQLGTNLLSTPVVLSAKSIGLHITAADSTKVNFNIARSHDMAPRWNQMNTSSGVFVDAGLGAWLTAMKAAGAEVIYTIFGTPTWASARPAEGGDPYGVPGGIAEPASMSTLSAFVTWLMTNYGNLIDYLEVWNEPKYSIGNASYFSGTPSKLAEMAKTINQAAKAVKPGIKILGVGCTGVLYTGAGSGIDYTNQFLAASDGGAGFGKDWIDILTVHTYAHDGANDIRALKNTKGYIDGIKSSNGISSKEVWSTEYSYITPDFSNYPGPDAGKGTAFARYVLWNLAGGMVRMVQYRYDGSLGWGGGPRANDIWNFWVSTLSGATVSVINQIGNGTAIAAVINGQRYIV